MFGLRTKLPISDTARAWADDSVLRLKQLLGADRMLPGGWILPTDTFFPDPYDRSEACVQRMAARVARYMGVDADTFVVHLYAQHEDDWRDEIILSRTESRDAAGLYFHEREDDGRSLIGVHANALEDPLSLVATLAHELAHVVLLGQGRIDAEADDMEPMTDLCAAYLGFGFFLASTAFQFKKWSRDRYEGWSVQRKGYLSEEMWGYVLARLAKERGDTEVPWARDLPTNVRSYFEASRKWLAQQR